MKALIVERDRVLHNLGKIKEASGNAPVIAVLKANAYGLGLCQMANLLRDNGVRRFAVTDPRDALRLRDSGIVDEEILILRSTACEDDIEKIITACATATIGSYDAAVALNGMAEKEGMVCDVHIKLDVGMGRYGFDETEMERILSVYKYMANLNVTGMYTHFPSAFKSIKKTKAQYEKFLQLTGKVRSSGYEPGTVHVLNSAALLYCKLPPLVAVRIGSALGGRITVRRDFGLAKTGKLQAAVAEVRWLPRGRSIGYGAAYVTRRPTKIAVVPIGSADGFMVERMRDTFRFRDSVRYALSDMAAFLRRKRFYITINGKRARVLGHVGVNHTTVDVTDVKCAAGDIASFDASPIYVPENIERRYI